MLTGIKSNSTLDRVPTDDEMAAFVLGRRVAVKVSPLGDGRAVLSASCDVSCSDATDPVAQLRQRFEEHHERLESLRRSTGRGATSL